MIIAVSGYNASGKSTVVSHLRENLEQDDVEVRVQRFSTLYPGSRIGKKLPERKPKDASGGSLGLRSIEAQRGEWNQPMGWSQFANVIVASGMAWLLAIKSRRRIVILDRFLYDRLIHFDPNDWRVRIARQLCFRPTVTLMLIPDISEHERRFLQRVNQRHGVQLEQMSEDDRQELEMVQRRYRDLAGQASECIVIDSSNSEGLNMALIACRDRLPSSLRRGPSKSKSD